LTFVNTQQLLDWFKSTGTFPSPMKKANTKSHENLKNKSVKMTRKKSMSMETLPTPKKTGEPLRKTSTPTHDHTTFSASPNVSHISTRTANSRKSLMPRKPSKDKFTGQDTFVGEELDLKDQLEFEYTRYLQAAFKKKLQERKMETMNAELNNLQKELMEKQQILKRTTQRLKNINFNVELDALHKLQQENYGKVLETLDNKSTEECLADRAKSLEQCRNQLKVKNIELPAGGTAELVQVITETAKAVKDLKLNKDEEASAILAQVEDINYKTACDMSKTAESLQEAEDLLLRQASLQLYRK